MCGRFTLTWEEWRQVAGALGVEDEVDAFADYRPRFNIAPTDQHFIITSEFERRKAQRARWGLVNRWARDNRRASQCINAKAETLEQRPSFSEAFQQRRCIVPVDGFYEWAGPKVKRQPLWIHPRTGGLLLFAGLHESWYPEKNRPALTFTIVTCAANDAIAAIHDPHAGGARRASGRRLDEPARTGSTVTETAARGGTCRSSRNKARVAARE